MSELMERVQGLLGELKGIRADKEALAERERKVNEQLLPLLNQADPDRRGVVFDYKGDNIGGWYQQNAAGEDMDREALIAWLRKSGHWANVSTTVLDEAKLAAEIAAKNIAARSVKKFMRPGKLPKPFVRFANPKPDSIR